MLPYKGTVITFIFDNVGNFRHSIAPLFYMLGFYHFSTQKGKNLYIIISLIGKVFHSNLSKELANWRTKMVAIPPKVSRCKVNSQLSLAYPITVPDPRVFFRAERWLRNCTNCQQYSSGSPCRCVPVNKPGTSLIPVWAVWQSHEGCGPLPQVRRFATPLSCSSLSMLLTAKNTLITAGTLPRYKSQFAGNFC